MKKIKVLLAGISMSIFSNIAMADIFLIAGLEFGGKELGNVYDYNTGERVNTIKAGEGLRLGAGISLPLISNIFSIDTSASYKFESQDIIGGNIGFSVIPLDAIAYLNITKGLRIGGGATYHINPTYKCEGNGCNVTENYDDGTGYIASVAYKYNALSTELRYTNIQYSNVDASNVGLAVTVFY